MTSFSVLLFYNKRKRGIAAGTAWRLQALRGKMKKRYIAAAIAIVAILFAAVIAAAGSEEKIVRDLIINRTETLNGYYDGDMKREDAIASIRELETGNLMQQDIDNIDRYFQTDIDRINSFEIMSIKITESESDMICATVYMKWDIETVTGNDSFMCDYSIICIKEEKYYKLAQFF